MEFKRKKVPDSFAFELSNKCNLAKLHPECPTKADIVPVFLDTQIIKDALDYLGKEKHPGPIYFNVYNEPLIDPRLFMLLEYNKEHCGAGVVIYTNGWGLNEYLSKELNKLNVCIMMSCYTQEELDRVKSFPINASFIKLDTDLKRIYDAPPTCSGICRFPSVYGLVNHRGEYGLCCRDYEYRHILGDLKTNSLEEIIESDYRNEICDQLEVGHRSLDTCKRCFFPGWGVG